MSTIDYILNKSGYSKKYLKDLEKGGICNGCGGKGGFNFTKFLKHLPYFKEEKYQKLIEDLTLVCDIHDIDYIKGDTYIDFIKANYKLARNIYWLLNWTCKVCRYVIAIIVFLGTTLLGYKYFTQKDEN